MVQARELLDLVNEISSRKKKQFEDQLKVFKSKLRSNPSDKELLQDAIKGTELFLSGKKVPKDLMDAIFKALEL